MDAPASGSAGWRSNLKLCCGQIVTEGHEPGHIRCNGIQMEYAIGALIIEMERCPSFGCGAHFTDPMINLAHQDSIHRLCSVCRGVYMSKGAFISHVVCGHGGTANFE